MGGYKSEAAGDSRRGRADKPPGVFLLPSSIQRFQLALFVVILVLANGATGFTCSTSWLDGYDCVYQEEASHGGAALHWTWTAESLRLALEARSSGWIGVAFPRPGEGLVGGDLVVLTRGRGGTATVGTFTVGHTREGSSLQGSASFAISDAVPGLSEGRATSLRFRRGLRDGHAPVGEGEPIQVCWGFGPGSAPTAAELQRPWRGVMIAPPTGTAAAEAALPASASLAAEAGVRPDDSHPRARVLAIGSELEAIAEGHLIDRAAIGAMVWMGGSHGGHSSSSGGQRSGSWSEMDIYRVLHGVLMWLSFSVLFPLAILVARHGQVSGCLSTWFHFHWIGQLVGSALVAAALSVALLKFDSLLTVHSLLGLGVAALVLLQLLLGGLLRPPVGDKSRATWYMWHLGFGMLLLVTGLANVYLGLRLYSSYTGSRMEWLYWAFLGQMGALTLAYALLEVPQWRRREQMGEPMTPPKASSHRSSAENLSRSASMTFPHPEEREPAPRLTISISRSMKVRQWSPGTRFVNVEL